MSSTLYPKPQSQFVNWLDRLAQNLALDPSAYGATEAQSDRLSAANAAFQAAYALAIDPTTRTRPIVAAKDSALIVAKREAKNIADIVRAAPMMTDALLAELGIAPRASRTRSQPPAAQASLSVVSSEANRVRVRIYDRASLRKADGAIGCVLMRYVGETAPADVDQWLLAGMTSKSAFDVVFPNNIAPGSKVWITARFVNRKLEQGPATEPPVQLRIAGRLGAPAAALKLAA